MASHARREGLRDASRQSSAVVDDWQVDTSPRLHLWAASLAEPGPLETQVVQEFGGTTAWLLSRLTPFWRS